MWEPIFYLFKVTLSSVREEGCRGLIKNLVLLLNHNFQINLKTLKCAWKSIKKSTSAFFYLFTLTLSIVQGRGGVGRCESKTLPYE